MISLSHKRKITSTHHVEKYLTRFLHGEQRILRRPRLDGFPTMAGRNRSDNLNVSKHDYDLSNSERDDFPIYDLKQCSMHAPKCLSPV